LDQAAVDARLLAALVPAYATRVDSPGSFVTRQADLASRRDSLVHMELRARMTALAEALEARGLRADAFAEFLTGAADLSAVPDPRAALDGPLGPWIRRHLEPVAGGVAMRSFVELRPDPDAPVPAVERDDGQRVTLHGPVVAARRDRAVFGDWLGIYIACGLWLGALFVWLGTRSLAIALAAALAALSTQMGLLLLMAALGQPVGPHVVPVVLLVGSAAFVSSARACRAVALERPIAGAGLIVASLCQIAAGLALVVSGEPLWQRMGLAIALGCALASGAGLFVAPGFAQMLGRLAGKRPKGAEQ
jgi:hypothetical protein